VDATVKAGLLELIGHALDGGWSLRRAAGTLGLDPVRAARWFDRRAAGTLADARPELTPLHALLDQERAAILDLYEQWGEVDRSHRKLAHRGSRAGARVGVHRAARAGGRRPCAARQSAP
jgi:hypothetical protein